MKVKQFKLLLFSFFCISQMVLAQDLGLAKAGEKMLQEMAKAFPYIAGIMFIIVGWKALQEYTESKDTMAALKIVLWYIIGLLVVVGGYQFVRSQAL